MLNFRHTCIVVLDLNSALEFYVSKLGMKIIDCETLEGPYPDELLGIKNVRLTYVKLDFLNQLPPRFELHYYENPIVEDVIPFGHISLTTENLDVEYERLKKLGVNFVSPPIVAPDTGRKVCFCTDPDFNLIELVEDV
jgi:catechol 2,3-dioxygenase-like lactoylglutathione lyase family enzyme